MTTTFRGTQEQMVWFDPTKERQFKHLPAPPTDDEIKALLSPSNPNCPLNSIIVGPANKGNLQILRRFAFAAYKRFNHSCRGMSFGLYGGAGQGKTYVAKQWAKTIGIPLVFIQCSALSDTWMLFQEVCSVFKTYGFDIVPDGGSNVFSLPPCIIALDEAHSLKPRLMKGGLLNAMEYNDGTLMCKSPGLKGEVIKVNCKKVCWIGMTTDAGLLFDAFESRLETHITWHPAGKWELKQIVIFQMREEYKAHDVPLLMNDEAATYVTQYTSIPRSALAFARKMVQEKDMNGGTWEAAAKKVAYDLKIDEWGMTDKQVGVIAALGQRPISKAHLAVVAQCRLEELERFVLPALMSYGEGGPILVPISGRGMALTKKGLLELDKRRLPHKGEKITAEFLEQHK